MRLCAYTQLDLQALEFVAFAARPAVRCTDIDAASGVVLKSRTLALSRVPRGTEQT